MQFRQRTLCLCEGFAGERNSDYVTDFSARNIMKQRESKYTNAKNRENKDT